MLFISPSARFNAWRINRLMMHIEGIRSREKKLRVEKSEHEEVDRTYFSPVLSKERKLGFEYKTHSQRDAALRHLALTRLSLQEKLQRRTSRLQRHEKKAQPKVLAA